MDGGIKVDWQRAKWILLISFAIVNIYLLFIYINYSFGYDESTYFDAVKNLRAQDIVIDTKIPKTVRFMRMLKVETKKGEKTYRINKEVNDSRSATKLAQELIKRYDIGDVNTVLKSVYKTPDGFMVQFGEVYNGYYVDTSYINVNIYNDRAVVKWSYLTVRGMVGKEKTIINGIQAIYSVLGETGKLKGTRITAAEIGYYFMWDNATSGEAIPAWKLMVDNKIYYVNAYTGNVEAK